MRNVIAVIVASVALVFGLAQPAHASGEVFTVEPNGSLPVAAATSDWSKNTSITLVQGSCSGPGCIHLAAVDFACGYGAPIGGCAYRLEDGSCQVEVSKWVWDPSITWKNTDELVTKHEIGHCVFYFGGLSTNYHLPAKPAALMSATHSSSPSVKEASLTSADRRFTKELFR